MEQERRTVVVAHDGVAERARLARLDSIDAALPDIVLYEHLRTHIRANAII